MEQIAQRAATGTLPSWEQVDGIVADAYRYASQDTGGHVADYIPALASAEPDLFGISVAQTDGATHGIGDVDVAFTIQSISKAFVYALVCDLIGHDSVRERIGVNNTGLAFNSVIAIELNDGHPMNPMVNAGAMATTALMPGASAEEQWEAIRSGLSAFAGRPLRLDEDVLSSEASTNHRNRAIAQLLHSYGRLDRDPSQVVETYTRQCALQVTATDLAAMGSTLADGGVNPITGERVVSATVCRDTLAVLAANGLYERSGEWLFDIGLPAKSGVAGGIVAVCPGKAGIGLFSPRLDSAGNSIRGRLAAAHLSRALGLNVFASEAVVTGSASQIVT
ncbi:glutaminase A [Hamadaea sp. NPDC051192]|uniref:glutaminase A n=1 Tax=Hamadaea sp. NPDC051192 TaxID=3154940 RepID=UPI00343744B1